MKPFDGSGQLSLAWPDDYVHGDLLLAVGVAVLGSLLVAVLPADSVAIRTVVGFPLLFFVPGYILGAVLYPGRLGGVSLDDRTGDPDGAVTGDDTVFRVALAFGSSVALLPLLALGHAVLDLGFTVRSTLTSLSVLIVGGALLAAVRRRRLSPRERYQPAIRRWVFVLTRRAVTGRLRTVALNLVLAFALVVAGVTLVFTLSVPISGESYTTFAVLSENTSGDLVAADYPTRLTAGIGEPYVILVENHERRRTAYTVVVAIQRVRTPNGSVVVRQQRVLDRLTVTLGPGQRWRRRLDVVPGMIGQDLRLSFWLYKGKAPGDPGPDSAYRRLHLWVTVEDR